MADIFQFIRNNSRWLAGGMLLTLFSSFGQTFFISQFSKKIRETFELSDGDFGMLYMYATLASAMTLVQLGKVVDHIPVSKVALFVMIALATACVGMSIASSVLMLFFVIYGLRLFGQGMMTHLSQTAIGKWYSAERGRAISMTSLGHQVGEATLPTLVLFCIGWVGWQTTWQIAAGLLLAVGLPAIYFLMKVERVPAQVVDLDPDGSETTHGPEQKLAPPTDWTRGEVLKDGIFWALMFSVLAPAFIGTAVFFHQDHIIETKGWPKGTFAASYMVLAISTIFFTLAGGWFVDRYSSRTLLPLFLVPMGIGCIVVGFSNAAWSIFVFMALLGWSYGFSSSLFGTIWPETYGTRYLGSIRSLAVAAMVFASALGPGLTGKCIDNQIAFSNQMIVMGIYCFMASAGMVLVAKALSNRHATSQS